MLHCDKSSAPTLRFDTILKMSAKQAKHVKQRFVQLAEQTLQICKTKCYECEGRCFCIEQEMRYCLDNSQLYLRCPNVKKSPDMARQTHFEVRQCTTLEAAHSVVSRCPEEVPLVLNFASAKNPGGGFLRGARAQEESLARSSGLYFCLMQDHVSQYYVDNRQDHSGLYTDHVIYSPRVPVFRSDDGSLLPFYLASFVTAPAVNAGVSRQRIHEGNVEDLILKTMRQRAAKVLAIALQHNYSTLILGAWGTGVFKNRVADVAAMWRSLLVAASAEFFGCFGTVIFAVRDFKTCSEFSSTFFGGTPNTTGTPSKPTVERRVANQHSAKQHRKERRRNAKHR